MAWATFSPETAQRVARATLWVEQRLQTPGTDLVSNARHQTVSGPGGFWAQLVDAGPEGEQDHPDARYWFRRIIVEDTGTPPLTFRLPQGEETSTWGTAYHITELNTGPTGAGTHALLNEAVVDSPARIVWVTRYPISQPAVDGPRTWFGFATYPGQMHTHAGFLVACLDASGCPQGTWVEQVGPGVIQAQVPESCT